MSYKLEYEGFRCGGYELGQNVKLMPDNIITKIIGFCVTDGPDPISIAVEFDNNYSLHLSTCDSDNKERMFLLKGYETSGFVWVDKQNAIPFSESKKALELGKGAVEGFDRAFEPTMSREKVKSIMSDISEELETIQKELLN